MAGSSWSSSSSCTSSLGSLDDDAVCVVVKPDAAAAAPAAEGGNVKFLCSYGGRILPRHSDGALRYVGGDNRVLSVDRSLHFYELQRKLREMCGGREVSLRCQLPTEDLDALVAVTSDDDLANLLEEYDAAGNCRGRLQPPKIRAFLFPRTTTPAPSPPSTPPPYVSRQPPTTNARLHRQNTPPSSARGSPSCAPRWWAAPPRPAAAPATTVASLPQRYGRHGLAGEVPPHRCLVHNGSHWP